MYILFCKKYCEVTYLKIITQPAAKGNTLRLLRPSLASTGSALIALVFVLRDLGLIH